MKSVRLLYKGKEEIGKKQFGLQSSELPDIDENEVLLEVKACGVCYRDIIDRNGGNSFLMTPITLGHEMSGVVVRTGSNVKNVKLGERVVNTHNAPCFECNTCNIGQAPRCEINFGHIYGLTKDGGYASHVVLHKNSVFTIPSNVSFEESCFLFCTAAVALRGLKKANFKEGDSVLITGASGGVGVHAIQLAKALNASSVIAITSSQSKVNMLKECGADIVILSKKSKRDTSRIDFHSQVLYQHGPVDIVLDLVGKPSFSSSLRSLKSMGSLVIIGNITATPVPLNLGALILREYKILGSSSATKEDLETVLDLVSQKKINPIISEIIPFHNEQDIYFAHQKMISKGSIGRIVLQSKL